MSATAQLARPRASQLDDTHDRRVLFAEHGHRSHGFGILQRHLGISNLEVVMNGNVATLFDFVFQRV